MKLIEQAKVYIRNRATAYKLTFQPMQPANVIVMEDLAKFCRAFESCVIPGDHDRTLLLEGRREVWLRIAQHLNLSDDTLYALYMGNTAQPKE